MEKSYIWSLPTRLFHWLFALFILIAFLTDDEDVMLYHVLVGYAVFILATFRVTWGFLGPKFSTFKTFELTKNALLSFVKNPFTSKQYIGHNPLASWTMLAMIVLPFIIVITGTLDLGFQEKNGLLASLGSMGKIEIFEELHETFANLLLVFIGLHLLGLVIDRVFHKQHETIRSMITGYKTTLEKQTVRSNIFQTMLFLLFLAFLGYFIFYMFFAPENIFFTAK